MKSVKEILLSVFLIFSAFPVPIYSQPGDFSLVAPSNFSQDVDVWPLFQWTEASGDNVTYTLQISTTPQFTEGTYVSWSGIDSTVIRPPIDLIMGEKVYYWRVIAINPQGQKMNDAADYPSNFFTFQTIPVSELREILGSQPLPFDRTLIIENSPYTIDQGWLLIPDNITLTVQQGVTIEIDGGEITVNGHLKLLGTESGRIVLKPTSSYEYWGGIIFSQNNDTKFNTGSEYESGSILNNVDFVDVTGTDIVLSHRGIYINGCHFNNCQRAIDVKTYGNLCVISNNQIINTVTDSYGEGGAIRIYYDNAIIKGNEFNNCKLYAPSTEGANPFGGGAVYALGNNIKIIDNIFSDCIVTSHFGGFPTIRGGGIYVKGDNVEINNNNFLNCELNYEKVYIKENKRWEGYIKGKGGAIYTEGTNHTITDNEINHSGITGSDGSGGGIYIEGNEVIINNNKILSSKIYNIEDENTSPYIGGAFGGGIYIDGDSCELNGNEIIESYVYRYSGNTGGGGLYYTGKNSKLINNEISKNKLIGVTRGGGLFISSEGNNIIDKNKLEDNIIENLSDYNYGGGIYYNLLSFAVNDRFSGNIITGNKTSKYGGGIYLEVADGLPEADVIIDSTIISGNYCSSGGGIYDKNRIIKIRNSVVTNNNASSTGGGLYNVKEINNCIIKYNTASSTGGIFGDPVKINYCDLNHNTGYQLRKDSTLNTDATYNWWYTRSDEIVIEESIYDGDDTGGSLGFATYQPFLTDIPESIPWAYIPLQIFAVQDSASDTPLNETISDDDTIYFKLTGIDNNPYSKDVAVIRVYNQNNFITIKPFYEETNDNSGTWRGAIIVSGQTKLPNTIAVTDGDKLRISTEKNTVIYFEITIGGINNPQYITPSFPSQFSVLGKGLQYDITWTDNLAENVKIELFLKGTLVNTVTSSAPSNGSFQWLIPSYLTNAKDYRIKITSTVNSGITCYSDLFGISETKPPVIKSCSSGNVSFYSATITSTVNPNSFATDVKIHYGITTGLGTVLQLTTDSITGIGDVQLTKEITGLLSNTIYYYKIVASNIDGISNSPVGSFKTLDTKPVISNTYTSDITSDSAVLNSMVNPNGFSTSINFHYGLTQSLGQVISATPSTISDTDYIAVSASLSSLNPGTKYYFCVIATSSEGSTYSDTLSFTSKKLNQTITFDPVGDKLATDIPFQLSATATSGLPVSFIIISGPATVSGNTVTLTGGGTLIIRAVQVGDNTYEASPYVEQTITVSKLDQTITFTEIPDKVYGDTPFALNASTTSGLAIYYTILSGPASISLTTLTITGAGVIQIRASQPGNNYYNRAAPVDQSITVSKASQSVTFNPIPDYTFDQSPTVLSGSSTSGLSLTYFITTGNATITGNSLSFDSTGQITTGAWQPGNNNYYPSDTVYRSFTVSKGNQSITWEPDEEYTFDMSPLILDAVATSGLNITYTLVSGQASLSNNILTVDELGAITIRASQAGNENYNPATTVEKTFAIIKGNQTIIFNPIPDKSIEDDSVELVAVSSIGLPVAFEVVSGDVSLEGNIIQLLGEGKVWIKAYQSGNDLYNAAEAFQSFCINPEKPVVTVQSETNDSKTLASSVSSGNQWFRNGVEIPGENQSTYTAHESGDYMIMVSVDSCSSTSDPVYISIISTGYTYRTVPFVLNVYPNPFRDNAEVYYELSGYSLVDLSVYNLMGQKLISVEHMEKPAGSYHVQIDGSNLEQGMYILRLKTDSGIETRLLNIQR